MSISKDFPVLSLRERDRRMARTRELLKREGLSGLVLGGLTSREQYDAYLTNDYAEGIVILPADGEPTYISWMEGRVMRQKEAKARGITPWIEDMRVGVDGPTLAAVIREKGLDRARLGVVGLESRGPAEMNGYIPYSLWLKVLTALPKAEFVEISAPFAAMMLVKSEEELVMMRRSAAIGEEACKVMLDMARPGVTELEITAEVLHTIFKHCAFSPPPFLILHSGPETVSWGPPIWRYQGGQTRTLQEGDMVLAEIFPRYGGFESQQQMAIALKPVDEVHVECARLARLGYEAGLKVLRPRVTFQKVAYEMEKPIKEAGCWHITPMIHSLSPLAWVGRVEASTKGATGKGAWESKDLFIEAGMVFELEPNAQRGNHRVNIGGTVVVTETGVEELNSIATQMHVVA
jgi:Xaa-Pro dipeptidase